MPKSLGPPPSHRVATAFSQLPRGFVNQDDGSLTLVDDGRGCVYSVPSWGGLDLAASYEKVASGGGDGAGQALPPPSLDFSVIGTPYELFFRCPRGLDLPTEGLEPHRCQLKAEEYDEAGDGRGSELTVILIAGIALVVLLSVMVIFACKFARGLILRNSFRRRRRRSSNKSSNVSASLRSKTESSSSSKVQKRKKKKNKKERGSQVRPLQIKVGNKITEIDKKNKDSDDGDGDDENDEKTRSKVISKKIAIVKSSSLSEPS